MRGKVERYRETKCRWKREREMMRMGGKDKTRMITEERDRKKERGN